jgi:hypothetical protein
VSPRGRAFSLIVARMYAFVFVNMDALALLVVAVITARALPQFLSYALSFPSTFRYVTRSLWKLDGK